MEKARMTRHGRPVVREVAMKERLAELGDGSGRAPAYRIDSANGKNRIAESLRARQRAGRAAKPDPPAVDYGFEFTAGAESTTSCVMVVVLSNVSPRKGGRVPSGFHVLTSKPAG